MFCVRKPRTESSGYPPLWLEASRNPGACMWCCSMKSSIPVHRRDTATWRVSAAQLNARQLRNLGVSHQHYTLHGLRGGGGCRSLAPIPRFATAATQGWWTSKRTLERCIFKKAHFYFIKNQLSEAVADWLQGSRRARAAFLCRTRLQSPPPAPAEPPR